MNQSPLTRKRMAHELKKLGVNPGDTLFIHWKNWNIETTKSTVGWITEYFRTMPGTYRSDHYSHSVAARGKDAKAFVAEHRYREGMKSPWDMDPWGYTYGSRSPMIKAYNDPRGKPLMLGVDYQSSTYCHVVETM